MRQTLLPKELPLVYIEESGGFSLRKSDSSEHLFRKTYSSDESTGIAASDETGWRKIHLGAGPNRLNTRLTYGWI